MLQVISEIKTVANTDVSIFLTGENGTGKSELAGFIHHNSTRNNEPMISVNMGSISESLFESEMFGHKKGAFTDAKNNRIGRFELAEQGTLFLDEITNIPVSQQVKLLRVLESGEYEVLGSSQTRETNIRVVSASNADVAKMIKDELFREDLYYRLNTIEFRVPSLKERQQDIIPLTEFFIVKFAKKHHRAICPLTDGAKKALTEYHWSGNIREMSHLVERAVLLAKKEQIDLEDLRLSDVSPLNSSNDNGNSTLPLMTLEQAEINLIKLALDKTDNHIPNAAKLLGLTKSSLYRRIEKFALDLQ